MHGYTFGKDPGTAAKLAFGLFLAVTLAGCKIDDKKAEAGTPVTDSGGGSSGTGGSGTPPTSGNSAPKVTGAPITSAKISVPYSYQPRATDPDGDALTFTIRSKPDWASFSATTGRLQGVPPPGSNGTYTGVQVIVSDGSHTVELPAFSITVTEPISGAAELAWEPPTTNEDGTPLTDLSGYVIRFGRDAGALDQSVRIQNAGTTAYVVENLLEGTWYFALSSVDSNGTESRPTGYVSKTIG